MAITARACRLLIILLVVFFFLLQRVRKANDTLPIPPHSAPPIFYHFSSVLYTVQPNYRLVACAVACCTSRMQIKTNATICLFSNQTHVHATWSRFACCCSMPVQHAARARARAHFISISFVYYSIVIVIM